MTLPPPWPKPTEDVARANDAFNEMHEPLNKQVGGTHYLDLRIQPAEYTYANGIGHLEGDVIAYVTRWRKKNGIEDLRKARHTLDILIALALREDEDANP